MSNNLGGNDELIKRVNQTAIRLAGLFLFMAVVIVGAAVAYTLIRIHSIQQSKGEELLAIADEKLAQIVNWRNERLGDGKIIQESSPFVQNIKMYDVLPSSESKTVIHDWIESIEAIKNYKSYFVFGMKGNLLITDQSSPDPLGTQTPLYVQQVIQTGQVTLSDLYKLDSSNLIRMDLLVPIIDEDYFNQVIAVIVMRIDPSQILYPMIENWPINSKSGETVLFRAQGNDLIYLNSLRFKKDAALNFVIPIDTPHLPAGLVIKGNAGIIIGDDYRGVPVIAAGRRVPNSNWYMVTKEDTSEAYAEVHTQAWSLGLIIVGAILAYGYAGLMTLRRGKEVYDLELNKATGIAEKLRQSYDLLFDMANDIVVVLDKEGNVMDVNDRAVEAYGYSQAELLQMNGDDLRTNTKDRKFTDIFTYLSTHNGIRYESEHIRKNGTLFPTEVSMRYYKSEGEEFLLCIVRDISERRQAEILLKENLNALQSIIDASPLGIITTDTSGNVTVWSPAAGRIFGWKEDEVIGRSLVTVLGHNTEAVTLMLDQLRENNIPLQLENKWNRKDGAEIIISISATLIQDYQGEVNGFLILVADVTEVKKIQEENERMMAERFRLLKRLRLQFEHMPIGFVLADEKLNVLDWNPQAEKIFGYSREEIIGKNQFDTIIPSEGKEIVKKAVRKAMNQNQTETLTHENLTKDGRHIMVEWHNTSLRDETGERIAIMAMAIDVTEKIQAEKLLRESEEKLRIFFDSNLIGIEYADIYGNIFSANDELLRIIGYSRSELESGQIHWDALTPKEFLPADQRAIKHALETGSIEPYEKQYIRKDGKIIWVLIGFDVVDKEKGSTIAFVLDITERKKAEQEFLAYHKLLDLVGDIGKIGGWDFDVTTGAGTWTHEVALIHDLDPDAPTNRDLGMSFYEPESRALLEKTMQEAIEKAIPYNLELDLVSAKGIHKRVRTVGLPLVIDGKVTRMRGIFQDITELKQAEAEVRKLNEELEQRVKIRTDELLAANRELEAFSYSVSHDLRAPLRAINGFSQLLMDEQQETMSPDLLHYLHLIRSNTRNMGQLIDDLLAFSRLGRQALQRNDVDMKKLVMMVIENIKQETQGREIEFKIKKLPNCYADETLLNQVFYNLISNAVKFTRTRPKAVVEIGSKKAIPRLPDGSTREIADCYYVCDNGVGFDMKYYDKLFTVFQRLHKAEEFEGTGVGLAIIKRVIEKHNGIVWAESTLNVGTTFYFSIGKEEEDDQSN